MNEKTIAELILAYLSGNISPEDSDSLRLWRESSPGNESLFRKLTSEGYLEKGYSRWRSIDSTTPRLKMEKMVSKRRFSSLGKALAYCAGAAAMLVVGLLVGRRMGPLSPECEGSAGLVSEVRIPKLEDIKPGHQSATLTTPCGEVFKFEDSHRTSDLKHNNLEDRFKMNNLEIPRGGEFHIILEDSTEVWLNAQSTLKYPEAFGSDQRRVELTGEAYFKVAKDPVRPFIVKTTGQSIKVYGTEFNVNSYEDDKEVVTTLIEGSIGLTLDEHSTNELVLAPGHRAVFSKEKDETFIKSVNTDVVTSWRKDMFVFDDQTLEKIMRQLSRWYDFEYSFEDTRSSEIVFVGRIPRYSAFGDVLSVLETSGGLAFRVEGRKVYISQR